MQCNFLLLHFCIYRYEKLKYLVFCRNMTEIKNLLALWYKEAFTLSSPFNLQSKIARSKVDFIHTKLLDFFGSRFFNVDPNVDKTINKIHWIYSLLANSNHLGCYHALHDICLLIDYSKRLDLSIQKELQQLKRNPENLRTFFFELFVYRILDQHTIPNEKKPLVNNQTLEGICILKGQEFLFECRKSFLPNISELDIKRRLMTDIWQLSQSQKHGTGMICTLQLSRPVLGIHRENAKQKLRAYFKTLNEIEGENRIAYTHSDEYGTFAAINYDEADLIEIKAKKEYDVLLYIVPPKYPVPGIPNYYHAEVACNFSLNRSEIYKKLETVLREKKKQHRHSALHKILFLDNETLPEFHMNLFQNESMYEPTMVQEVYNKIGFKDILCIIKRQYDDDGIHIHADVIGPKDLSPVIVQLSKVLQYPSVLKV